MKINSAHFLPGRDKQLGNKYLLLDCLGDGSHGWVWRAERLSDNLIVAVKIPKNITLSDRSLAEGKELIGIKPHPNVIQIYDMGRVPPEKEWYAIEMEYFPSESLAQKLEQRSHHFGNTYQRLFNIYTQVLDAVEFLSQLDRPISHGDIKPHNILIGQGQLVKLTDFGSSALPEEIYVRTRENGGTVLYSAPEFCDCVSRKGNFAELLAGDIYSLGVLLYQLMTGELPHDTQAQVLRYDPFRKPSEINHSISKELDQVILRCLEKEPTNRFQSIEELKIAFTSAVEIQNKQNSIMHLAPANNMSLRDWTTDVVASLEKADYLKAANIAGNQYFKTKEKLALLQQLNALYRAERWFDFAKVVDKLDQDELESKDQSTTHIRELTIKVFMKLRRLDSATHILNISKHCNDESLDLAICEASIDAMEARYDDARKKLETINKRNPRLIDVLSRLILVCEQSRDYNSASGYLRAALKIANGDEKLARKRHHYELLGLF
ncbi:Serine/threonine-protein kinase PrkC [Legionella massiliensis]|uniref:Serine/threonine-protein kinase PrkC n=1 Tax=Legionella massiliensis TaxID=1034943 RepID=A0A078KQM1_9GAMM|nr:serine/threonine-protein kinase [Legionella massiliensis]CDZ76700.1 Serine/threonine-protein kinase PrkC [Legionella massiliensis]CEE12438.1 Serine/threonine-protein kinase PrkC [Legionella massiliensis]